MVKKCDITWCKNNVISPTEIKRRLYSEDNLHYGDLCEWHSDNLHFLKFGFSPLRKFKPNKK